MPTTVLRTFGVDSNPAGVSPFVGIPVPVGVRDGDVIIAAITLGVSGVTVTPPDEDWTLIAQTDPAQACGVVAFWKVALNEGTEWVFALSDSVQAVGGAAIFANVDIFGPVEVVASATTASATTQDYAGVTASLDGEMALLLVGTSS